MFLVIFHPTTLYILTCIQHCVDSGVTPWGLVWILLLGVDLRVDTVPARRRLRTARPGGSLRAPTRSRHADRPSPHKPDSNKQSLVRPLFPLSLSSSSGNAPHSAGEARFIINQTLKQPPLLAATTQDKDQLVDVFESGQSFGLSKRIARCRILFSERRLS